MDFQERRAMWQGFGDGFAQAFEMAAVPILFALAGWALDRWLGTSPGLTIALALAGVIGAFLRTYYWYVAAADRADEGKPWSRRR